MGKCSDICNFGGRGGGGGGLLRITGCCLVAMVPCVHYDNLFINTGMLVGCCCGM